MIGSKIIALAIIVAVMAAFGWHVYDRARAYEEGRIAERTEWQAQRIKDMAQRESERLAAQKAIAKAEADYLTKQASQQIAIADLEKALEDEKNDSPAACGPALSKRLRDSLNAIGR